METAVVEAVTRAVMDPQAAWDEMLDALTRRDWPRAEQLANDLLEWMRKKGFAPQTTAKPMRPGWNRAMAEFGCMVCLQQVDAARNRRARKEK
jgi:hypothetical protein